jgi:hypothetical protein
MAAAVDLCLPVVDEVLARPDPAEPCSQYNPYPVQLLWAHAQGARFSTLLSLLERS